MDPEYQMVRQLKQDAEVKALRALVEQQAATIAECSRNLTALVDENMALKGLLLYARPHVKAAGDTDLLADIDHYCGVPKQA